MENRNENTQYVGLVFIVIVVFLLFARMDQLNQFDKQVGSEQIEENIQRLAIQCYALEGAYPSDLAYLEDHYGLILNQDRYLYYYDAFASNLLPDIQVTLR